MDKITNKTVIDFKTFRDYYFLNLRRNKLVLFFSILGAIATIMIGVALVYNLINYFFNGEVLSFKTFQPIIILGIIYVVYYGFIYFRILSTYHTNKSSFQHPIVYTFEENRLLVSTQGAHGKEKLILPYQDIIGIYENKKYMVIALTNNRSTLVRKDAFSQEERSIISTKMKEMMDAITEEALKQK